MAYVPRLSAPSTDRLNELLTYNPETGLLRYRMRRGGIAVGSKAGFAQKDGYVVVTVDRQEYPAHRLIWLICHHEWPEFVDHKNGDRHDNRLSNLRSVTRLQNNQNSAVRSHSKIGLKGVIRHKGSSTFYARIRVNGKRYDSKSFCTAEEAHSAYLTMSKEHFGEFHVSEPHRLSLKNIGA